MNRGLGVLSVVVLGLLAAALFGLAGGSVETSTVPSASLEESAGSDPEASVVASKRRTGGFSVLGVRLGGGDYVINVQLFAGPDCFGRVQSGDPWPNSFPECSSPVAIAGVVAGGGITSTGRSIIGVDVEVSGQCHADVTVGAGWPPTAPSCADHVIPGPIKPE